MLDARICCSATEIFLGTSKSNRWTELPRVVRSDAVKMPSKLQGEAMTDAAKTKRSVGWVPIGYALVCTIALGFDLLTDRSFGASMLAVLPISLLALGCLLVGPWMQGGHRARAAKNWLIGAALILLISLGFSLLGADQAKTGETIFTYATLVLVLPASLVLPVVETLASPLMNSHVLLRMTTAWGACLVLAWLEWAVLSWLYRSIRQRARNSSQH